MAAPGGISASDVSRASIAFGIGLTRPRGPAEGPVAPTASAGRLRDDVDGDSFEPSTEIANTLTPEQEREVEQLKQRDREVRAHEQAHLAAAGGLALSGAVYQYRRGPDGNQYAVGGSVAIDVSKGATPEETIRKAAQAKAAALAPADPSSADLRVAAKADRLAAEARAELARGRDEDDDDGERDVVSTGRGDPEGGAGIADRSHPLGVVIDVRA
ncbi:MAG: hypothetical protein CMJ31_12455 [Phycisphaerae bacterium]|nr:hypothetical protein [Phycisphaerae bacterium]